MILVHLAILFVKFLINSSLKDRNAKRQEVLECRPIDYLDYRLLFWLADSYIVVANGVVC
jgi:hypothetical protein